MHTTTSPSGTTLAYTRIGDGKPVVLVGGAFQLRTDPKMEALAAALAPTFTVYNYDRRGRGDSGDAASYAVEREVEDLAAVIDAAGGPASVFGMSSGAVLALRAAAAGLPITKLALYEPPFVVDDSRAPLAADYVQRLTTLLAGDRRGDAVALFLTDVVAVPVEIVDGMRQAPFWAAMEQVAHTLPYDGAVMGETMSGAPDLPTEWSAVTIPVLVVNGGASAPWIRNAAGRLAALLPAAERSTLPDQDHDVDPEILGQKLHKFFVS